VHLILCRPPPRAAVLSPQGDEKGIGSFNRFGFVRVLPLSVRLGEFGPRLADAGAAPKITCVVRRRLAFACAFSRRMGVNSPAHIISTDEMELIGEALLDLTQSRHYTGDITLTSIVEAVRDHDSSRVMDVLYRSTCRAPGARSVSSFSVTDFCSALLMD